MVKVLDSNIQIVCISPVRATGLKSVFDPAAAFCANYFWANCICLLPAPGTVTIHQEEYVWSDSGGGHTMCLGGVKEVKGEKLN